MNIAFIADENYIIPTSVSIYSIKKNKSKGTILNIYIITSSTIIEKENVFRWMEDDCLNINFIYVSTEKYASLHQDQSDTPCVATVAALFKFELPELLNNCDKVLYLDGDLIVRQDLSELYETDIEGYYAAAVIDSGSIYYKHEYVEKVQNYFNSGVMLLNLKKMREDSCTKRLIEEKLASNDHFLMDQNVFNVVFNGMCKLLPIKYNCLYVSLIRSAHKYKIDDINLVYGTEYHSINEVRQDAVIIHYSSKDKPWKSPNVPLGEEWRMYYAELCTLNLFSNQNEKIDKTKEKKRIWTEGDPLVSVIIPVYNTCRYLGESILSIVNQTLRNIEIICINDGSTDNSFDVLNELSKADSRITVLSQENMGQSIARNRGIEIAKGKYYYFFDSDDYLVANALEMLYKKAEEEELDLLLFDGITEYENATLQERHSSYQTTYIRKQTYNGVWFGIELYPVMVANGDYKVSPCLQFIRSSLIADYHIRYRRKIVYEDNLFSMQTMLFAQRVMHIPEQFFVRRVRCNSTMTSRTTYKNFRSYFTCLIAMMLFIQDNHFPDSVVYTAARQLNWFYKTTARCFMSLPEKDRKQPWLPDMREQFLGGVIFTAMTNATGRQIEDLKNQKDAYKKRNDTLLHSKSYKIGRFITFIPRQTRNTVRALREHGIRYTIRKIKNKLTQHAL